MVADVRPKKNTHHACQKRIHRKQHSIFMSLCMCMCGIISVLKAALFVTMMRNAFAINLMRDQTSFRLINRFTTIVQSSEHSHQD